MTLRQGSIRWIESPARSQNCHKNNTTLHIVRGFQERFPDRMTPPGRGVNIRRLGFPRKAARRTRLRGCASGAANPHYRFLLRYLNPRAPPGLLEHGFNQQHHNKTGYEKDLTNAQFSHNSNLPYFFGVFSGLSSLSEIASRMAVSACTFFIL